MRTHSVIVFVLALASAIPSSAGAQDGRLTLSLGNLASRAKQSVNISIDKTTVDWATQALSSKGGDTAKIRALMKDLDGIAVQSFEFEKDKAPTVGELIDAAGPIIRELDGQQWKPIINVTEKHVQGTGVVRVSLKKDAAGEVNGFALLAIEPGVITLVNLTGKIRLDQLGDLGKALGHPGMLAPLGGVATPKPKQ